MIVTVSLNPAIDKYLRLSRLRRGRHQQAGEVVTSAGGKAINVAGVVRALREPVALVGFFGGMAGEFLLRQVADELIEVDPVRIASPTRTAFVLVEDSGVETEIVEPGGAVTASEIDALRIRLRLAAATADVVVLSGSVPPGCDTEIYLDLLRDCCGDDANQTRCPVIVDTSREWLSVVVRQTRGPRPVMLKPNRFEAEQILGRPVRRAHDYMEVLEIMAAAGVATPLVSAGAAGMYVAAEGELLRVSAPRQRAINSVGSGDATVAGLAVGLARGYGLPETLRLAAACGAANVLTKECAQVLTSDVERLRPQVKIRRLRQPAPASRRLR